MDIAFANASALEVIRRVRLSDELQLSFVDVADTSSFASPRGSMGRVNFLAMGLSSIPTAARPACIRVPRARDRKAAGNVRSLLFPKHMPAKGFMQLKLRVDSQEPAPREGASKQRTTPAHSDETFSGCRVFVDSVPLACASIAASYQRLIKAGKMSEADAVVRLVELVMEFAGHYGRDPANPLAGEVTENIPAMVSVGDIRQFLASSNHLLGKSLLAKALHYARDESRSPMETCLWIVLTMPHAYGLFGLDGAKLNTPIVPTATQRAMMRHKTLTPDILWESQGCAVEYQGVEEHTSKAARAEDNRRLNDYQTCGIRAHFVGFEDVRTAAGLDRLARQIAESMAQHGAPDKLARLNAFLEDDEAAIARARHLAHLLPPVDRS